jgi:hypothetical protein
MSDSSFMEPDGSLSYSQDPGTGPHLELYESSLRPKHYLSKIHFNIIFPFATKFSKLSVPFRFSNQNLYTFLSPHAFYISAHLILLGLTTIIMFCEEYKARTSILCVQTGSGAHPASCTMGTVGPFPGVKRGRGVTQTTHPHLVPRL